MSDVSNSFSAWETLPEDEPPLCIAVRRPVSPPRHYEAELIPDPHDENSAGIALSRPTKRIRKLSRAREASVTSGFFFLLSEGFPFRSRNGDFLTVLHVRRHMIFHGLKIALWYIKQVTSG
ncbi:hypothetical protein RB195_023978 [Necator americanus]|uniref:Uncharacterized protein n=1 Tax=Necator americanus TaxID=51031 RepID=A0ABR1ELJ1_NECAM